ncbi:NAD(P)/FAD-dependent oxidoreductase [Roseibium sp.]|uniref:NAD(P)/FAD-dependent oxidoreductase n=1 Tax=Roseibium sp. TaxID=1936156 RepID=UPI003A977693
MSTAPHSPFDLAVAGGGIFGLNIAYRAIQAGMHVVVLEADHIGAGASGGLLGALMPHMPARWNPKKQFQFDALSSLPAHVQELEATTGMSAGYRACGRILPIVSEDRLAHHHERAEEALERWKPQDTGFSYRVEPHGAYADWLSPSAAPHGLVHETLAARVAPRDYLAALAHAIRAQNSLLEGVRLDAYDEVTGKLDASGHTGALYARNLVLATGYEIFPQIAALTGPMIGRGEKGQAVLLEGHGLEERPAIYCDGLYVVPHDNGTVAVGSTSERHDETRHVDAEMTDELLRRAVAFCPALAGRAVLERWAGVRPRCNKRDPLVGRLPGQQRTYIAAGGFKISFGIAHLLADALIAELTDTPARFSLPETFRPGHHFPGL